MNRYATKPRFRCFIPHRHPVRDFCVIRRVDAERLVISEHFVIGYDLIDREAFAVMLGIHCDYVLIADDEGNRTTIREIPLKRLLNGQTLSGACAVSGSRTGTATCCSTGTTART